MNISKTETKGMREIAYFRQRYKNRVFAKIASFFVEEAKRVGITKGDIARRLDRDPAQVTRWLSNPSNMTLETISDLLLALDAEPEPPRIVRFSERLPSNYAHPMAARALGVKTPPSTLPPSLTSLSVISENIKQYTPNGSN